MEVEKQQVDLQESWPLGQEDRRHKGDTFRAAAFEQLDVWAERTGSDIEVCEEEKKRPAAVLA